MRSIKRIGIVLVLLLAGWTFASLGDSVFRLLASTVGTPEHQTIGLAVSTIGSSGQYRFPATEDNDEYFTHVGRSYRCGETVSTPTTQDWLFVTPDTATRLHAVFNLTAVAEFLMEVYEAPTITDNGSGMTAYNRDRNSGSTSTAACYDGPTVSATGSTLIFESFVGSSGPIAGGGARATQEWILKQNTAYLIRGTNESGGGSQDVTLGILWEEVD